MAQRTEKEETEFKVPETLSLCINNCGLTGNLATNNMCQKCFNATTATTSSSPSSTANITTAGAVAVGPSVLTFSGEQSSRSAKTHLCNKKKKMEVWGLSKQGGKVDKVVSIVAQVAANVKKIERFNG
ncbi:hypothetical protein SLEP1_g24164 [Rubroshorea leprosula]|uniref:A20-type domain-containing protein n=1 Tax=Rubroshorea leprosula TaxID=152421 RepID=A0AAV5JNF3_9ROSI|nr:hypothetical protein SLEP1_g24164 [Rubroshorea leprosula]